MITKNEALVNSFINDAHAIALSIVDGSWWYAIEPIIRCGEVHRKMIISEKDGPKEGEPINANCSEKFIEMAKIRYKL